MKYYLGRFKRFYDEFDYTETVIFIEEEKAKLDAAIDKYGDEWVEPKLGWNHEFDESTFEELVKFWFPYMEISKEQYDFLRSTDLIQLGLPEIIENTMRDIEEELEEENEDE